MGECGKSDGDEPEGGERANGVGEAESSSPSREASHTPRHLRITKGNDDPDLISANRRGPTWHEILNPWTLIEVDFQDIGLDVETGILKHRSARWLRVRILGLLYKDSRLSRAFAP